MKISGPGKIKKNSGKNVTGFFREIFPDFSLLRHPQSSPCR
jgi:hypothetical protein